MVGVPPGLTSTPLRASIISTARSAVEPRSPYWGYIARAPAVSATMKERLRLEKKR